MDFTLHTGRKIPASRIAFRTRTNFSIGMKMSQRAPSLKAFDVEFRHTDRFLSSKKGGRE